MGSDSSASHQMDCECHDIRCPLRGFAASAAIHSPGIQMRASKRGDQRGTALIMTGICVMVLFALAALGIDVAHLALTASEVQAVADASALAGAQALVKGDDAVTSAQGVAAVNQVEGAPAMIPASAVDVGKWANNTFQVGGSPSNAVRSSPQFPVQNILASIWGAQTTTVSKTAVAAFETLSSTKPNFPLALGSCFFDQYPCYQHGCSEPLTQVPNSNDSYWASLDDSSNTNKSFDDYLPTRCGGSGTPAPTLTAGTSSVYLTNGQVSNNLDSLTGCIGQTFVVPVVQGCGNLSQHTPVIGFATLRIDAVVPSGKNQSISVTVVFNGNQSGTFGGSCSACGTGRVSLVQ